MRMTGNSAHTSAGGGGHNPNRTLLPLPRRATAATGRVEGHGKRSGTSGDVVHTTIDVRETMSENGIMGR